MTATIIQAVIQWAVGLGGLLAGSAAWFKYRLDRRRANPSDASSVRQLSESAATLLEPYQRAVRDLGSQLAAVTARTTELEVQLTTANRRAVVLEQQLAVANARAADLDQQQLATQAEMQELRNQVSAMAKELKEKQHEVEILRTQPMPPINPPTT